MTSNTSTDSANVSVPGDKLRSYLREHFFVAREDCIFPVQVSLFIYMFCGAAILLFLSISAITTAFSVLIFVAGGLMIRFHGVLLVFYIFNAVSICYIIGYYAFFGDEYFLASKMFELYEKAIFYYALGFCSLAIGLRVVLGNNPIAIANSSNMMKIEVLFVAYLIINFIVSVILGFSNSQVTAAFGLYKDVILYWLIIECIIQRRGWIYIFFVILVVSVPGAASYRSEWSGPLFVIGFSILIFVMSNENKIDLNKYRSKLIILSSLLVITLGGLGVFWNGNLKIIWRTAVTSGEVGESTVSRLEALPDFIDRAAGQFRLEVAAERFASRLSAGVPFFAMVVGRVPEITPHQDGRLTLRAISHVLQPRFLFPDKEDLGSDSAITSEFTGLRIAGLRENTSIGLGYIPQFYIDFGVFGIIFGGFVFGGMVGLFLLALRSSALLPRLAAATWAAYLSYILQSHASDLAKLSGAMVSLGVAFYVMNKVLAPLIQYWMDHRSVEAEADPETTRAPQPG